MGIHRRECVATRRSLLLLPAQALPPAAARPPIAALQGPPPHRRGQAAPRPPPCRPGGRTHRERTPQVLLAAAPPQPCRPGACCCSARICCCCRCCIGAARPPGAPLRGTHPLCGAAAEVLPLGGRPLAAPGCWAGAGGGMRQLAASRGARLVASLACANWPAACWGRHLHCQAGCALAIILSSTWRSAPGWPARQGSAAPPAAALQRPWPSRRSLWRPQGAPSPCRCGFGACGSQGARHTARRSCAAGASGGGGGNVLPGPAPVPPSAATRPPPNAGGLHHGCRPHLCGQRGDGQPLRAGLPQRGRGCAPPHCRSLCCCRRCCHVLLLLKAAAMLLCITLPSPTPPVVQSRRQRSTARC